MDVINKPMLDAVKEMVGSALRRLREVAGQTIEMVKDELRPLFDILVETVGADGLTFGMEVELLEFSALVSFAKEHIVEGSNEIVVTRTKEQDATFIYMAYAHDRELLPKQDNRYLIIKATKLADDVEALFKESELIILK